MKWYLLKTGKSLNNFLELEIDGHLLRRNEGKVGLKSTKKVTHCGNYEKALIIVQDILIEYKNKGYKEEKLPSDTITPITFDKADWHYSGDFPKGLSNHQAYIHIGFFVGWLINNSFYDQEFEKNNFEGIKLFNAREITAPTFFDRYLDGIFSADYLKDEAIKFSLYYYSLDLSKSLYINDVIDSLSYDLPSVYHIEDSWSNFDKIYKVIDQRFIEWKSTPK
jgi:predicted DNA-binding WGR domain protein